MTDKTEAILAELLAAVDRLTAAVEKLSPAEVDGQVRFNGHIIPDPAQSPMDMERLGNRRAWARNNGLADERLITAFARSGLDPHQLSEDTLCAVRQCGTVTIEKLVTWAAGLNGQHSP